MMASVNNVFKIVKIVRMNLHVLNVVNNIMLGKMVYVKNKRFLNSKIKVQILDNLLIFT